MFSPGPSFAVPPVLDALGYTPPPWERPGTSPAQRPDWLGATEATAKGLTELASGIGPLIASIALAGYEVDLIAAAPLTSGRSVDGHVVLETAGMAYLYSPLALDVALGHPLPPGKLVGLGCHVTPRRRFRPYAATMTIGDALAMALPGLRAPTHPGPPIGGGRPGAWLGTGVTDAAWELLHDPDPVRLDGGGWWLIGLSASVPKVDLSVMAAAAVDASAQLGALVGGDLHAAWTTTPTGTTPPGLLRIYDADSWHFPDGESPFADQLRASCYLVQGWLGRRSPNATAPVAFQASPAQVATFFVEETGQHTGSLEAWLNLATGRTGGSVTVESLADAAHETLDASGFVFGPSEHGIGAALRLPWGDALMALHELGLVDLLGREQIGAVTAPEWVALDGTGFLEQRDGNDPAKPLIVASRDDDDTGIAADTAQLKIAGDRLVGYWQEHQRLRLSPRHPILSTVEGQRDRSQPATFTCTRTPVAGGPPATCTVVLSSTDGMTLVDVTFDDPGLDPVTLVRTTGEAFLSDHDLALVDPVVADTVAELQRHPLHSAEVAELFDIADQLTRDIDAYFDDSVSAAEVDAHFAIAIAAHVTYHANGSIASESVQRLQAQLFLRAEMKGRSKPTGPWWWPSDQPVDYVRRIQDMKFEPRPDGDPLTALTAFFELGTNFFWYDWELQANPGGGGGFNFGGGGTAYWSATMTIRKWRYVLGQPDRLDWEASYWAMFGGAGLGWTLELTSGFRSTGKSAWVRMDLTQEWFEGAFATSGIQGGLSKGPVPSVPILPDISPYTRDKNVSKSTLTFGPHPADAQGNEILWTDASGLSDLKGVYIGAELSGTRGELFLWEPGDEIPLPEESGDLGPRAEVATVAYSGPSNGDRFFDSDVSTVDPVMRSWLRDFCLDNLHLFRNRQAVLAVVGHADPEGTDEYNLALSVARASSVYEVFSDVLGPHLALPEEHTFIGGRGEWESAGESHPELFQGDRRVDLYLNGDRVISVQAAEGP